MGAQAYLKGGRALSLRSSFQLRAPSRRGWARTLNRMTVKPKEGNFGRNVWLTNASKNLKPASLTSSAAGSSSVSSAAQQATGPSRRFGTLLDYSSDEVALGGHRGMGVNQWSLACTHRPGLFRENTLKSFREAARMGVTFIEFDVQVTADGVPVSWHDNYVVFGDPASPTSKLIKELTYAEFCQLAPINASQAAAYVSAAPLDTPGVGTPAGSRARDALSSSSASPRRRGLLRKLQNAVPAVAGEPSLHHWECSEEDHFPTLAEVFAGMPPEVAFDIEVKMTTPDDEAVTPPEEVSRILDAILAVVDAQLAAQPRRLLFSSFDPEVCIELKRRLPAFPVMFLSGGGAYTHVDERRTSIPAAINFAAGAALEGIILESATLKEQQPMIEAARSQGLQVMTYGLANDDPEWVRKQFYLGVHGVIVDDVSGVVKALSAALA